MLKRIISVISVLVCVALLCACGQETAAPVVDPSNESATAAGAAASEQPATEVSTMPGDASTETTSGTTQSTTTRSGNSKVKAIMEPQQGGPMLYTFKGRNGKLGLINQDGKVIAEPQFDGRADGYFRGQTGEKLMGIVMNKDTQQYIYSLDGSHVKFNEQCILLSVEDGRTLCHGVHAEHRFYVALGWSI